MDKKQGLLISKPEKLNRRCFLKRSLIASAGVVLAGPALFTGCRSNRPIVRRPIRTKYNTVAHQILDIEQEHIENILAAKNYQILDSIIDAAFDVFQDIDTQGKTTKDNARLVLHQIHALLLELGFEYEEKQLICFGLRTKRINCDGFSALYLAVGEALDLPIQMVRAPVHTFVRWQMSEDDYVNWETTKGVEKDDAYYILNHDIAEESLGTGALKSLDVQKNRDQILANAYVNSGVEWLKKCNQEMAILRFKQAIKRDPSYETPYYNLGLIHFRNGQLEEAIGWCKRALEKNPNHLRSHAVLKTIYSELNRFDHSQKHFAKIMALDPDYYLAVSEKRNRARKNTCRRRPFLLSLLDD
ncbi:MAG: tetratricopeptide repeat protein [Myxococcota bacterium]|nr:tetratricopeptide repeat protein [Myxococcota bacterium]